MDDKLVAAIGVAVTALAGAVATLWKHVTELAKAGRERAAETEQKLEAKLGECEEKHAEVQSNFVDVIAKVSNLEGQIAGYHKAREEIGDLSKAVLKEMHKDDDSGGDGGTGRG